MMVRHIWNVSDIYMADNAGTGDYGYLQFINNSMYNVYSGQGGTGNVSGLPSSTYQPQWRDFMTSMYSRYCVIRSRIKVTFSKVPTSTDTDVSYGCYVSVYRGSTDSATSTIHPTSPQDLIDMRSSSQSVRYKQLLTDDVSSKATIYLDGPVFSYDQMNLAERSANAATSPISNPTYAKVWYIGVTSMADINKYQVRVNVTIEHECLWTNRITAVADDI